MRRGTAVARALVVLVALPLGAAACSQGAVGRDVSVFRVRTGQCLVPPKEVKQELSKVRVVPCNTPHTQEAYAVLPYTGPDVGGYPGDAALKQFADGACAQRYQGYVGVDYQDSAYFFTYLLPSPRGWDQGKDRKIVCFVTTTGQQLRASVKGSGH